MMNVALTGFMGCGKTTYGRAAAERAGTAFFDLDDAVLEAHNAAYPEQQCSSLSEVFRDMGEDYFRNLETSTLRELLKGSEGVIIALGGGAVVREENRAVLKENCRLVWLRCSLDTCLENISATYPRPLLQGKTRDQIEEMFAVRSEIYSSVADAVIDTDALTFEQIADSIIAECDYL
ncbi:MAG: shikimate kinase [Bacteroidales bacterium]|nr:shikimate kinase [Bacteroidales bacterium]MBO7479196.1 shikimate kinase [Bacteroidales bacterium]